MIDISEDVPTEETSDSTPFSSLHNGLHFPDALSHNRRAQSVQNFAIEAIEGQSGTQRMTSVTSRLK